MEFPVPLRGHHLVNRENDSVSWECPGGGDGPPTIETPNAVVLVLMYEGAQESPLRACGVQLHLSLDDVGREKGGPVHDAAAATRKRDAPRRKLITMRPGWGLHVKCEIVATEPGGVTRNLAD